MLIYDINEIIKIIESSGDGIIRIWNFHNGNLLSKIKTINGNLYGVCLWNNNNLFVGCSDNTIRLIDLNKGKIIKNYLGHIDDVVTIKKINHPNYGECLISYGGDIILWIKK